MEFAEQVSLPVFHRASKLNRKFKILLSIFGILVLAEGRSRAVTRLLRAIRRGLTAAIASYIEERGGLKLFTLEDEELPEVSPFARHGALSQSQSMPSFVGPPSDISAQANEEALRPEETLPTENSVAINDTDEKLLSAAKLFACMELEDSRKLLAACEEITLLPHERLFSAGDSSESGAFIVCEGTLGVYLDQNLPGSQGHGSHGSHSMLIATLHFGESVGDIDLLDGVARSVTCRALEAPCKLVGVPRDLFLRRVVSNPRVLHTYLNRAIARLWRVGHFTLTDFLQLPPEQTTSAYDGLANPRALTGSEALRLAEVVFPPDKQTADQKDTSSSKAPHEETNGANSAQDRQSYRHWRAFHASPGLKSVLDGTAVAAAGDGPVLPAFASQTPPSPSALTRLMQPIQGILRGSQSKSKINASKPRAKRRVSFTEDELTDVLTATASAIAKPSQQEANAAESPRPAIVVHTCQASLAGGWDIVSPEETGLGVASMVLLSMLPPPTRSGQAGLVRHVAISPGNLLHAADEPVREFYILLEGAVVVERSIAGRRRSESALVAPGSFIDCAAFLTATRCRAAVRAAGEGALLAAVGTAEIEAMISAAEVHARLENNNENDSLAANGEVSDDASSTSSGSATSMHTALEGERSDSVSTSLSFSSLSSSMASPPPQSTETGSMTPQAPPSSPAKTPWETIPAEGLDSGNLSTGGLGQTPRGNISTLLPYPGIVVVDLLLAAARSLGPVIRQFIRLGLSRVWLRSGEVVYRQGQAADALYIVISGRARLLHAFPSGGAVSVMIDDEVGRGESCGAVWAVTGGVHDTTCLCVRDLEAVRMSKASFELISAAKPKAAARVLQGMASRLAAAGASRRGPSASSQAASGSSSSRDIAIIAVLPAGIPQSSQLTPRGQQEALTSLARSLRAELESAYGPTSLFDFAAVKLMFKHEADHLHNPFFRAKITTWISQQEEDCRFIVLVGWPGPIDDAPPGAATWSGICVDQADCVLLVASAADGSTSPQVGPSEETLVWRGTRRATALMQHALSVSTDLAGPGRSVTDYFSLPSLLDNEMDPLTDPSMPGAQPHYQYTSLDAASSPLRRVELVFLHPVGSGHPHSTSAWLDARPLLTRHHHIRPCRAADVARLARWIAGRAVGVVLSGGGSRGLAHLGVLRALHDAGVPVDVVGGASQGAFMAGLYAQDVGWSAMQARVARYASQLGSVRALIQDLTLPLLSVFTGRGFDRIVKEAFDPGPQRIEDLWLRFFCVTTNLTLGTPQLHQRGSLWRAVRASSTLIGLVPPVVDDVGHLLCDGGYSDNLPVAAMRGMGVGTVIVVDVEDRDQSAWLNLTPTDGGVSGWQLMWDRVCPVPSWRFGIRMPGHAALVNALSWMSHRQSLVRLAQEGQKIDLYLRPPVLQYRLLDYHLMDRIVRDASRYAFVAVADWQRTHACSLPIEPSATRVSGLPSRVPHPMHLAGGLERRSASVACMTQLQAKQMQRLDDTEDGNDVTLDTNDDKLLGPLQFLQRAATAHPEFAVQLTTRLASLQHNNFSREGLDAVKESEVKRTASRRSVEGSQAVLPLVQATEPEPHKVSESDASTALSEEIPSIAAGEDQFKFLENMEVEFLEEDLPWS